MSPEEWRKKYVSDLASATKLDTHQIEALNKVLDETRDEVTRLNDKARADYDAVNEKWRPEREALHNRQIELVKGTLRADQVALYDAFRAERERQRKLHDPHKKQ